MKNTLKWFVVGFLFAGTLIAAAMATFLFSGGENHPLFREQTLPSGKKIQVASFHLTWGIEHDERRKQDDQFAMEYVSSAGGDPAAQDREALEVFELVRPISELWGFPTATVSAFPTTVRKGRYSIYAFTRDAQGKWGYQKTGAKVFANDQ